MSAGACADDFDPYGRVTGFRVLALRADAPELLPGQSTRVDALVVSTSSASVRYRWRWCPLIGSPSEGFECALDETTLRSFLPSSDLSFELGNQPVANFAHPFPSDELQNLCDLLSNQDIPSFQNRVNCDDGLEIYIRLDAEAEGQTVSVLKTIRLAIDEDKTPNRNPNPPVLDLPVRAERSEDIEFGIGFEATDAETYEGVPRDDPGGSPRPLRERLIVSWFATAGTFDPERETFVEGERSLDDATSTTWTSPFLADFPDEEVEIFGVLRDDRGGTTWSRGSLRLQPGETLP